MRNRRKLWVALACLLTCFVASEAGAQEPERVAAFAFNSRDVSGCGDYNVVLHNSPASIGYDEARGWGYEALFDCTDPADTIACPSGARGGYGIYGPFDDSPNNRGTFPDGCPADLYDSFIGAKGFAAGCVDALDPEASCEVLGIMPEGIIFRIDNVPDGRYRFVAVAGSPDNAHSTRILVENGGEGPPDFAENLNDHVVLVNNYDQGIHGVGGTLARVGFGCIGPPGVGGVTWVNMDEDGLETDGPAESPTLEVTDGYIRIHQLQGNATSDVNGGNIILFELWRIPDGADVGNGVRTEVAMVPLGPNGDANYGPGDDLTLEVTASAVQAETDIAITFPEGWTVADNAGGTVADNVITLNVDADETLNVVFETPAAECTSSAFSAVITPVGGCPSTTGVSAVCIPPECGLRLNGAVSQMLQIGPIDLGVGGARANGGQCNDTDLEGRTFADKDYLIDADEEVTEANILVSEGDEVSPDFGGLAGGLGVAFAGNFLINPFGDQGVLEVWSADADANGLINMNDPDNIGDPVDDYVFYSLVYLENTTGSCLATRLEVGSDDAVKVLVNGQLVHSNSVCRGVAAPGLGDMVDVTLAPGVNIVLICVVESGGGTGVRLIVTDPVGTPFSGEVVASCEPPQDYPAPLPGAVRSFDAPAIVAGESAEVTLTASGITGATTLTEVVADHLTVTDAPGANVEGNTLTWSLTEDGAVSYTVSVDACPAPGEAPGAFSGSTDDGEGCGLNTSGPAILGCINPPCDPEPGSFELIEAFGFGSRDLICATHNDPGVDYTMVVQIDPLSIQYDEDKGYGFEPIWEFEVPPHSARGGWEIFGPIDESPNGRDKFPDNCPEEIYDSFIGAKNWAAGQDSCTALINDPADGNVACSEGNVAPIDPEGIIFRVDVPNGTYRFVAAVGESDNNHAHRLLAENGGEGPPTEISADHVVLINNFDQAQHATGEAEGGNGNGVFGRVGFGDKIPPPGDGVAPSPVFVDHDEDGFATGDCPSSPTLVVTEGFIRIHSLQGNSNDGPGGARDANGGDLVILEFWRVSEAGEICDNGVDDDDDGDVDCLDSDCEGHAACPVGDTFVRGDADASGSINLTDGVNILLWSFQGGPEPSCLDAADTDNSGAINLSDPIRIFQWLFLGGAAPVDPEPAGGAYLAEDCGLDTGDDAFDCANSGPVCAAN